MPSRRLPRSDDERSTALRGCQDKYDATAGPARLITAGQATTLGTTRTAWDGARNALPVLMESQVSHTAAVDVLQARLRTFCSHFFQVFEFAVVRGVYPAATRVYYGLPAGDGSVPVMDSEADLLLWSERLITGENSRVTAGGAPMTNPSGGDVNGTRLTFISALGPQGTAKDAADAGQQAIGDQRPAVDALILDLWDTIEYNLRHETPESLRRRAREWGIVYEDDPAATSSSSSSSSSTAPGP